MLNSPKLWRKALNTFLNMSCKGLRNTHWKISLYRCSRFTFDQKFVLLHVGDNSSVSYQLIYYRSALSWYFRLGQSRSYFVCGFTIDPLFLNRDVSLVRNQFTIDLLVLDTFMWEMYPPYVIDRFQIDPAFLEFFATEIFSPYLSSRVTIDHVSFQFAEVWRHLQTKPQRLDWRPSVKSVSHPPLA
jgi:hypothetical protein